ncbi:tripartite tricarboxylate transporter permease [Ammoniphilus sp. 3BR4]|uniref:tripartite tricarboxylate transporter permease n=1 Tax=Ammoniphilus sp. 3BR4 TaxID=3158265 RepID=UPI0034668434
MDIFPFDVSILLTWSNLFALVIGTMVGMLIGAIPGMGATLAVVLLLPLTYLMDPLASILLLLATYQACEYGGSISAVVLGVPGTPAALVTALDGHAMAKQNSPGKALAYSLYSSFIGGLFGAFMVIFLSSFLVKLALLISEPEYFWIGLLGLLAVSALSSENFMKSLISAVLGLMAATIGMDDFTGGPRFTLGYIELLEGLGLIALLVGMFAFTELFFMVNNDLKKKYVTDSSGLKTKLTFREIRSVMKPIGIGSVTGAFVGIFPGMGAGPAAWFSYSLAQVWSKTKSTFGKGNPEGIAAPEAANNAAVGGALIPLLSLGIPGSPTIAIISGAFIIHGLQPGPTLFKTQADLVYGVIYGFLFTTIFMFVIGRYVTSLFSRAMTVSNPILVPIVFALSIIGVFLTRSLHFDLCLALLIGVVSYLFIKLKYSIAAFILAYVLGPIIEESFRRSLIISAGNYDIFYTRPFSIALICIIVAIISWVIIKRLRNQKKVQVDTKNPSL